MGYKTKPKSQNVNEDNPAKQSTETQPAVEEVSMEMNQQAKNGEASQLDRVGFSTPHAPTPRRLQADRPRSAHVHRVCGRLLRLIGDDYLCSSCGKALQTIGDELTTEYAIRKALSCNDLEKLQPKR